MFQYRSKKVNSVAHRVAMHVVMLVEDVFFYDYFPYFILDVVRYDVTSLEDFS